MDGRSGGIFVISRGKTIVFFFFHIIIGSYGRHVSTIGELHVLIYSAVMVRFSMLEILSIRVHYVSVINIYR